MSELNCSHIDITVMNICSYELLLISLFSVCSVCRIMKRRELIPSWYFLWFRPRGCATRRRLSNLRQSFMKHYRNIMWKNEWTHIKHFSLVNHSGGFFFLLNHFWKPSLYSHRSDRTNRRNYSNRFRECKILPTNSFAFVLLDVVMLRSLRRIKKVRSNVR